MSRQLFILEAGDAVVGAQVTDSQDYPLDLFGNHKKFWEVEYGVVRLPYLDSDPDLKAVTADIIGVGLEIVLSKNLLQTIKSIGECAPHVEELPITLRNRAGDLLTGEYVLVFAREWYNVLNIQKSGASLFPKGQIDVINKWVADPEKIPQYDFFFAHCRHWLVSQRIGNAIRGRRNVRLTPVPT